MASMNLTITIPVLLVSAVPEDHACLKQILDSREWMQHSRCKCELHGSASVAAALPILERVRIPVILCDDDRRTAKWKELLDWATASATPPHIVVTSGVADDYLWAEALNLGAHDVLATPFVKDEVIRVVGSAWLHWVQREEGGGRRRVARAAS